VVDGGGSRVRRGNVEEFTRADSSSEGAGRTQTISSVPSNQSPVTRMFSVGGRWAIVLIRRSWNQDACRIRACLDPEVRRDGCIETRLRVIESRRQCGDTKYHCHPTWRRGTIIRPHELGHPRDQSRRWSRWNGVIASGFLLSAPERPR